MQRKLETILAVLAALDLEFRNAQSKIPPLSIGDISDGAAAPHIVGLIEAAPKIPGQGPTLM